MDLLSDWYLWTKSLHIISVLAWMAGLFYLPRLFVYHVEQREKGRALIETLETMERRLYTAIMTPSAVSSWVFGGMLVMTPGIVDWGQIWPWSKMAGVVLMTGFHIWLGRARVSLLLVQSSISGRQFRMLNELPTVLMIVIVLSVVLKF